jgi:hypothetical protein
MGFKLGSENRKMNYNNAKNRFNIEDASVPGTPVIRKSLPKGVMGEANNDGTIYLSDKVAPGSQEERKILMHEMKHMVDMKVGKLAYTDDTLTWMGETYERKNGKIKYNGKWSPEGDTVFPWEQH